MIRYYLHRPNKPIQPLIHIRETLQIREKLRYREPTGYSLLSSVMIRNGREVIGCIVLRLTRSNLPHLLYLCMGQLEKSSPLSQSQGIFYHILTVRTTKTFPISLIREEQDSFTFLSKLSLNGWTLSGRRGEAIHLKLELEGSNTETWSFGKDGPPAPEDEGFFFLNGREIETDKYLLPDLAAFSISGKYSRDHKTHELMIRRKDSEFTDYRIMRKTIQVRMVLTCRGYYEPNQRIRCEISIEKAYYLGEENFPDNKGIWGREFRYAVPGSFSIRVFTHLDDQEVLLV